jgi:UDP-N-acetylmuramoyl-L-alanyl-D-glutamate--2,6-diaminopimelate ligase
MILQDLLPAFPGHRLVGNPRTTIGRLRYDSRQVEKNDVFFAWKGEVVDGHSFIPQVRERGASAVVLEDGRYIGSDSMAYVEVEDARRSLAYGAAEYFGHPSRQLTMIGVTGTNGKTTTAFLIKQILEALRGSAGLIGTVRYEIGSRVIPAARTTPEGSDLQDLLAQMRDAGCLSAVMEVSSHALQQGRVAPIDFNVGVFTNLTQDHLDFHGTMEHYFAAKQKLFTNLERGAKSGVAVVNVDDAHGRRLAAELGSEVRLIRYSVKGDSTAELHVEKLEGNARGSHFTLRAEGQSFSVKLPLLGTFNVENAMAAVGAVWALGYPLEKILTELAQAQGVPGRMESFHSRDGVTAVVDYSHTDDAVRKALETLRALKPRALWVVLGCGGNRDKAKRPLMARAACTLADHAVFTSDNPRNETPADILNDMTQGVPEYSNFQIIEDRREAIAQVIALSQPGDIVCVAGKGHEDYQEIQGRRLPFDDRTVVQEFLQRRSA